MAAPLTRSWAATASLNSTGTSKTISGVALQSGDVVTVTGYTYDDGVVLGTPSGITGATWTLRQSYAGVSNYCNIYIWTTTVPSTGTYTLSITRSGTNEKWGYWYEAFYGSAGVGATTKATAASGAPSFNLTTTGANSAVVVAITDYNEASSITWRTGAGAFTQRVLQTAATYYGGRHGDAGAAGSKTLGATAPSMKWNAVAVEILGTAAPTAPTVGAGADASVGPGETFARTATEQANNSAITSRAWTIVSGPTGVGTTIGTTAALSWTNPGTLGAYVVRYSATNGVGTGTDDVTVTVAETPPTWVGDVEAPLLDQFFDTDYDQRPPNELAVVSDVVRSGSGALRFTVVGSADVGGGDQEQRVEVSPRAPDMVSGATWWLGFSTRLREDFPHDPPSWQICMQLHSETNEPPPVELSITGGRYRLTGGRNTIYGQDLGPSDRGSWADWQIGGTFSSNPSVGEISVWRDGVLVLSGFHPPDGTLYDAEINYVKLGIYRDEANPASVGAPAVLWIDHMSTATSRSGLLVPPPLALREPGRFLIAYP